MQTDLRYPSVADEHEEKPISSLPAGVGSMPGEPKKEVKEEKLISGRGVIP